MSHTFISTLQEAALWRDQLEAEGKKVVFTNGVFDLLHVGHVRYLNEARALGDALIVAINGDESVRELKGEGRPVYPAEDRAEILCALGAVDRVVVFDEKRATNAIESVRPHIYTKGGDYTAASLIDEERDLMTRMGIEIQILSLVEGQSTSNTLKKLENEDDSNSGKSPRIAVLGSGTGSNANALIAAVDAGTLKAEVALIMSDAADSGILRIAAENGITGIHIEPGTEKRGRLTDAALKEIVDRLKANRIDLVILAGFMRVIREPLLSEFDGKILNIHPSLLPEFPGLNAARQAIEANATKSGCTVHLVDSSIDGGKILAQSEVPIFPEDNEASLQSRIQEAEHVLFAQTVQSYLIEIQSLDGNRSFV